MRRGEVWWADLPPPAGRRPVLLLSRNEAYAVRQLVTVAPFRPGCAAYPPKFRSRRRKVFRGGALPILTR